MTAQAQGYRWSIAIHGMLILVAIVLQSFAAPQTKVAVIDFTFSDNPPSPVVEPAVPSPATVPKQESKPARVTRPQEIPPKAAAKEEAVKEVVEREIVKEVTEEPTPPQPDAEEARSPAEVPTAVAAPPPAPPRAFDGPGGSSPQGTGSSIPSPRGTDTAVARPATGGLRDGADRPGSTRGAGQGATEGPGKPGAAATPETARAAYLREHFVYIRDRITGGISYPRMARKMGWCGQVKIAFVVCEDGGVNDLRVVESSGFTLLDRNAVETVKQVAPFPSPPVKAEIRMAITYRLH